jgi:hypothetical protein
MVYLVYSLLKLTIPNCVTLANFDCPICAVLLSCTQRLLNYLASQSAGCRRGRDRMVVRLMTTYVISPYYHQRNSLRRDVVDTKLCDEVCQ